MSIKISQLPAADTLTGAEVFPINQGGVTKRTTLSAVAALSGGGGLTLVEQAGAYTFELADANTGIVNPFGNGANAYTVPGSGEVDFEIGTMLVVKNADGDKAVTVTIEDDVFEDPMSSITATEVVINPYGYVTFVKTTVDGWTILGFGYTV